MFLIFSVLKTSKICFGSKGVVSHTIFESREHNGWLNISILFLAVACTYRGFCSSFVDRSTCSCNNLAEIHRVDDLSIFILSSTVSWSLKKAVYLDVVCLHKIVIIASGML